MSIIPYKHQTDAIKNMKHIESISCGGFLSHDMGLGKTITMSLFLKENKLEKPDLIVCPFSVVDIWKREIKKIDPGKTMLIYHGKDRHAKITSKKYDYIITTYSMLASMESSLMTMSFGRIVLDESHCIKNGLSGNQPKCAQGVFQIAKNSIYRWCISGTPFNNRILDIASQCKFIGTAPYNSKDWWKKYSCSKIVVDEWRQKYMLLKDKDGLVKPLKYIDISVEPTSMESSLIKDLRAKVARSFSEWKMAVGTDRRHLQMQIMALITRLRIYSDSFYCGDPNVNVENAMENCSKLSRIVNDIDDYIQQDGKNGLVIFSQFTTFISILKKCILECLVGVDVLTYTGNMDMIERDVNVRLFNENRNARVIIVSLMAGGTGLSLHHGSSTVIISEPCYNPFAEKQAEERVHRLGQENDVNIIRYKMTEGVESWMDGLKKQKINIASTIGLAKKKDVSEGFSFSDVAKLFSEHVSPTSNSRT